VEGELIVGYEIMELVELNIGGGVQRFFFSLNPDPSDAAVITSARVAGGAIDQYIHVRLGATLRL
jgi:hypothetical protein